jgi:hypothetical protein
MYTKIIFLFLLLTAVAAQPPGSGSTDICPVCLEDLALVPSTVTLECAHTLCLECYTGIYRSQRAPSCPLCRAPCSASPEQLQRRRPAAPTPRSTPLQPLQPRNSNGATAPPPLDDGNDGWETIQMPPEGAAAGASRPPELLRPAPTRMPCTPTPRPSVVAPTRIPAPQLIHQEIILYIVHFLFYFIDRCVRGLVGLPIH